MAFERKTGMFGANSRTLFEKMGSELQNALASEYIFYFQREDLLSEVRFLYGNKEAQDLEKEQYFYPFKDFAFQQIGKKPQIIQRKSHSQGFLSALFFPLDLSWDSPGILVLGNPKKGYFEEADLQVCFRIVSLYSQEILFCKHQNLVDFQSKQLDLVHKISHAIDFVSQTDLFFKSVIRICEKSVNCQIVIFLMKDESRGDYFLKAGNDAGSEFWVGQTEFFRSLARESEQKGIFVECYGGKYFKGEKYGLERLETALVAPLNIYEKSRGVFIFLNKNDQQNFNSLDIRMLQVIQGYSKAILSREQEKKQLVTLFKRFVSERIGDQILSDQNYELALEGRETITAVFMDLNGFTGFTEVTDPHIVTKQLNIYFQEMTNLILKHSGSLDKYLGDGIMAIFGSPIKIANHAQRAVECALAMQEKMSFITQKWLDEGLHPLTASIGIHTGEALVGAVGCEQFLDYTAIGDTVNVASRLCSAARAGTILIGESTWERMKDVLICEPVESLKLKGKSTAIRSFEVGGLKNLYELREMLKKQDTSSQIRILRCLGSFGTYRDSDLVLDFLDAQDRDLRLAAIDTVGDLNREGHLSVVIERLDQEESPEVQEKILSIVSKISSDPLQPLLDKYVRGIAPGVRPAILKSTIDSPSRDDRRLFLALIKGLMDGEEIHSSMIADLTHLLYQNENVEIMSLLVDSLQSASDTVKKAILGAFSKIEIPQVAIPVASLLQKEKEKEVRIVAAKTVATIKNDKTLRVFGLLFRKFAGPFEDWARFILYRREGRSSSCFVDLLQSQDEFLQYSVLSYLCGIKIENEYKKILEWFLEAKAPLFCLQKALVCLSKAPDEEVLFVLKEVSQKIPALHDDLLFELGRRKQVKSLPFLHEEVRNQKDAMLKMKAILSLGMIGDLQSLPVLLSELENCTNANVEATLIKTLGNFRSGKVVIHLLNALHSPIGRIRANAIDSLMMLNETYTVNQIERLLQDDNNRVRANAALACLRFGRMESMQVLTSMAKSSNKWMRLSCLWALSVTGLPEARELILGLLRDPDYDVVLSAVQFVKKISGG